MARDKVVRVEKGITTRVDKAGQLYWDFPETHDPKANQAPKADKSNKPKR